MNKEEFENNFGCTRIDRSKISNIINQQKVYSTYSPAKYILLRLGDKKKKKSRIFVSALYKKD